MIYSPIFAALPAALKQRVYRELAEALSAKGNQTRAHLPDAEKASIRQILKGTLTDLPKGW